MNRLLPFLVIFLFAQCKSDINGHWHIKQTNSDTDKYLTLDIRDDTIATLEKFNLRYPFEEGIFSPKDNGLFFRGNCGMFDFNYKVRGDKLILTNYLEDWEGIRCDSKCCTPFIDIAKDHDLKITLPKILANRDSSKPFDKYHDNLYETMLVGNPIKDSGMINNDATPKMILDTEDATIIELPNWIEKKRSRRPEQNQSTILFRIAADENIKVKFLKPIIESLQNNGVSHIAFLCLKPEIDKKRQIFEFVRIEGLNLEDDEKALKDVLNKTKY